MRDLFLQLGIDPEASTADIEAAIKAKPELEAAAQILLNNRRRAPYQRTVLTLRSIGLLRHRLALDKDDTWFVQTCPDFTPRLHMRNYTTQLAAEPASPTPAATENKATGAPAPANAGKHSQSGAPAWLKPALLVLVLAAVAAVAIVLL